MSNIYFNFVLADNDVDYDGEVFTIGALADIRRLCIGHYGIFDCTTYKAKVIEAHLMQSCGDTKDGRTKYYIYATAEMPNNEDTRKIISKIESEKPKASISCCVHHMCTDNGVLWISSITDFYEFSIKFDREYESDTLVKELEKQLEVAKKQNVDLLQRVEDLEKQLAEVQDEPEIPDFPKFEVDGEDMWYIRDTLKESRFYTEYESAYDFNSFHTREYAEYFRRKCLLIAMMLHCKWYIDRDLVHDWDNCDDKFTVWYNHSDNEWTIDFQEIHETPSIYFSTEEAAQKCADWLNKHWRDSE